MKHLTTEEAVAFYAKFEWTPMAPADRVMLARVITMACGIDPDAKRKPELRLVSQHVTKGL